MDDLICITPVESHWVIWAGIVAAVETDPAQMLD